MIDVEQTRLEIVRLWHKAAQQHTAGYLSKAVEGWTAVMEMQRQKAVEAGYPIHTRYLPDVGWTATFGHMAVMLEIFAKMKILGLTDTNFVVLADPERIVNQTYFDLIKPYLAVSPRNAVADIKLTEDYLSVIEFEGRWTWYHDVWTAVQQRWYASGRGPLLVLPQDQIEAGRQKFGLKPDDWFAVLHTRDLGDLQNMRDTDVSYYAEELKRIEAAGGRIIKVPSGDAASDIFLLSQARFGIFGNSGPAWVAGTFGTPALLINYAPVGIIYPYRGAVVLHKKLRHKADGRLFEPNEYVEPFNHVLSGAVLSTYGVESVPCGLEEIITGIEQMLASVAESIAA